MPTPKPHADPSAPPGDLLERIERVLDDRVRPDLRRDGGDVIVV
jgi:Fe-S cluster biogenesis protein NfuA